MRLGAGARAAAGGCLLCCGIFLFDGLRLAPLPGLNSDEAVHAAMAVEMRSIGILQAGWTGSPFMKDTYQGTLKSLLLLPIFSAAGAGRSSLRAATLAAGAIALCLAVLLASRLYGAAWGLVLGLWMATDPKLLLASAFDSGPAVLSLALKLAGLCALLEASRRKKGPWAFLGGMCLGLAVWDKSHSLWLLACLPPAALLAFPQGSRRTLLRQALWAGAGAAAGAAPWLCYNLSPSHPLVTFRDPGHHGWPLAGHLRDLAAWHAERLRLLLSFSTGEAACFHVAGTAPAGLLRPLAAKAALAGLGAVACLLGRAKEAWRHAGFWAALAAGVFYASVLSPVPVKFHHYYVLYPLPELAVVALLSSAAAAAGPRNRLRAPLLLLACLAVAGAQAASALAVRGLLERDGGGPAFYRGMSEIASALDRELEASPGTKVFCEAGFDNPIYVETAGRVSPLGVSAPPPASEDSLVFWGKLARGGGQLLLLYSPPFGFNGGQSSSFFRRAQELQIALDPVRKVPAADGRPWAAVYRARILPSPRAALIRAAGEVPGEYLSGEAARLSDGVRRYARALEDLEEEVRRRPPAAQPRLRRGLLRALLERSAGLLARRVESGSGSFDESLSATLAEARRSLGECRLGLEELDRAISKNPRSSRLRTEKGLCLSSLGRLGDAVRELRAAVWLDPRDPSPCYTLSTVERRRGNAREALALAEQAVDRAGRFGHPGLALFKSYLLEYH